MIAPGKDGFVRSQASRVVFICTEVSTMTSPAPFTYGTAATPPLPRSPQEPYPSIRAWYELERRRSEDEQAETIAAGR